MGRKRSGTLGVFKQTLLSNLKEIGTHLSRVKYTMNTKEKKEVIDFYFDNRTFPGYNYVGNGLIAKSINEIGSNKYIPYSMIHSNLMKEIEWNILLLKKYSKQINRFVDFKMKYEKEILIGEVNSAKHTLKNIQQDISYSFWGIEQTMLCSELEGGFKANRELLSDVAKETSRYIVLLLSEFYSYKAELDSSYHNFIYRVNSFFKGMDEEFGGTIVRDYLEFQMLLFDESLNSDKLSRILSISSTFSIIDIYENLVRACSMVISSDAFADIDKKLVLDKLNSLKINDTRIGILNIIINTEESNAEQLKLVQNEIIENIIEYYTVGNYKKCLDKIIKNQELFSFFEISEIFVKSCIYNKQELEEFSIKKDFFLKNVLKPMYNIFIANEKDENLNIILNTAKMLGDVSYKYKLVSFFVKHGIVHKGNYYNIIGDINSKAITPRLIFSLEKKEIFLKKIIGEKKFSWSVQLFSAYISGDFNNELSRKLPEDRIEFYKFKSLKERRLSVSLKDLSDLEKTIETIIEQKKHKNDVSVMFHYDKIALELFDTYLEKMELNKALSLLVSSYLLNKSTIKRMDKKSLKKFIENSNNELDNIHNIILEHIIDEKDSHQIYTVLVNFLESNTMLLPSDLIDWVGENEKHINEVNFILSRIYVKEIMKHFVRLTPKSRNEERIKVLEYLAEKDLDNASKHLEEKNEILKKNSIKERVKSVDEMKIFVDSDAILIEFESMLKEKFRRYMALKSIDSELRFFDLNQVLSNIEINQATVIELNMNQEKKQRYLLFKEMITDFTNELLLNPKYGLAKFLSARIRHGLLENNLTKTFKHHKLFALKANSEATDFTIDKYWDEQFATQSTEASEEAIFAIKNALSEFTKKIVDKVEQAKNWMRIADKNYPDGMFNYKNLNEDSNLFILYGITKNEKDFRQLYGYILDFFWGITEYNLSQIKKKINQELHEYFVGCLEELSKEISEIKRKEILPELCTVILNNSSLCRTALRADLNQISNWFVVKRNNSFHDYDLKELLSTCSEINSKTDRRYELIDKSEIVTSNAILRGSSFYYFVDIFAILYNNAVIHSGFENFSDMKIVTEISEISSSNIIDLLKDPAKLNVSVAPEYIEDIKKSDSSFLKISMENLISKDKSIEEIEKRINDIHAKIKNPEKNADGALEEGGTGILKIYNILSHNIGSKFFYQYVLEDKWVSVEYYIQLSGLQIIE